MADQQSSSGDDPDWTMVDKDVGDVQAREVSVTVLSNQKMCLVIQSFSSSATSEPNTDEDMEKTLLNPQSSTVTSKDQEMLNEEIQPDSSDSDLVQLDEDTDDHLDDWVAPKNPNRRCSQNSSTWVCNNDSSSDCSVAGSDEDDDLSSVSEDVVVDVADEAGTVFDDSCDPITEELPADFPRGYRSSIRTYVHTPNNNVNDWLTTVLLVVLAVVVGVAIGHFHGSERSSWVNQRLIKPQDNADDHKLDEQQLKLSSVVQQLLAKHSQLETKIMDMNLNAKDSLKELRDRVISLEDENRDLRMRLVEGRKKCTRILHKWPISATLENNSESIHNFNSVNMNISSSSLRSSGQVLPSIHTAGPLPQLLNMVHAPLVKIETAVIDERLKQTDALVKTSLNIPRTSVFADSQGPGFVVGNDDVVRIPVRPKASKNDIDFIMVEDVIVPRREDKQKKSMDSSDIKLLSGDTLSKSNKSKHSAGSQKMESKKQKLASKYQFKVDAVNGIKNDIRQEKVKLKENKKKSTEFSRWQNASDDSKPKKQTSKEQAVEKPKCTKCRKNDKDRFSKDSEGYCYLRENKYRNPEDTSRQNKNFWDSLPPFIRKHFTKTARLERILRGFGTDIVTSKVFRRVVEEVPKKLKMSTEFWNCQWNWWNNFARSRSLSSYNDCAGYLTSWQYKYRKDQKTEDQAVSCSVAKSPDPEMDFSDRDWFLGKLSNSNHEPEDQAWYLRRASSRAESRSLKVPEEIRSTRNSTWWFFGRAKDRENLRNKALRSSQFDDTSRNEGFFMFPPDPIYEFLKQRATWHGSYHP